MKTALLLCLCAAALAQDALPDVVVDRDDFVIDKSCRVVPPIHPIFDAKGDGVLLVRASNVTIEFAPTAQLTNLFSGPPDLFTGVAIRIDGQENVTLRGPRIRGYKVGIWATNADGLVIDGADLADMFRQRLRSTPAAEDSSDWLWPHNNDKHEWRTNYGAAICVEQSKDVTIKDSRGRTGQNGIILDRVESSKLSDNDFSFLSGWGLAMWRSSWNVVSRNAFDFCVRGYSHGVYNRGQDSAGILMFEQCSNNLILENSVTHGGDGVFGFAGKEALGETPPPSKDFDYKRRGCNDNVIMGNDLSYAAAHGLEMTFSFGNVIALNRFVQNAICGIWGGYSQNTTVGGNQIIENGAMGYGLERGGVNIEHGFRNKIHDNEFARNRCGVHLWWSDNKDFPKKPWGLANYQGCKDNLITTNQFKSDDVAIHLRAATSTTMAGNTFHEVGKDVDADAASSVLRELPDDFTVSPPPESKPRGTKTPVGARAHLRGRENIIMTEWGPWDHDTPLVRLVSSKGAERVYALHKIEKPAIADVVGDVTTTLDPASTPPSLRVAAKGPGVTPYRLTVGSFPLSGTIVSTKWTVRFFPTSARPHENPDAWARDSTKPSAPAQLDALDLRFGMKGPADGIGPDHFGLVAETRIPLRKGKWRITTMSDDGIRVTTDGKKLIDRWNWHAPTKDEAILDLPDDRTVPLRVEYFELDGFAVLSLDIEQAP
jgi:nitrous oxidase accessory protein NosD